MSSWADDYESACTLAQTEALKLREKNPEHELLKYWFAPPEDLVDGELDPIKEQANREEMKKRFWDRPESWQGQPGLIVCTIVMGNYYVALKRANEGMSNDTPLHVPPPKTPVVDQDYSISF